MTDTPAEQLRAAAARLRALATAATEASGGATWRASRHFPDQPDSTYTSLWAADRPLLRGGGGRGRPPAYVSAPVGDYIAAMHPGVGLALAAWLDSAAEDAEQVGAATSVVAVARLILGQEAPHA